MLRVCVHCHSPFRPHTKVASQKYCSGTACQTARRRQWQKRKLQNDEDYRKNQRDAQRIWRKNNPDYWKKYRMDHPEYADRNRSFQIKRNLKARGDPRNLDTNPDKIAKMDDLSKNNSLTSGYYMLYPVAVGKIAKMDEMLVKIDLIQVI
jgi:hypothetical protein